MLDSIAPICKIQTTNHYDDESTACPAQPTGMDGAHPYQRRTPSRDGQGRDWPKHFRDDDVVHSARLAPLLGGQRDGAAHRNGRAVSDAHAVADSIGTREVFGQRIEP